MKSNLILKKTALLFTVLLFSASCKISQKLDVGDKKNITQIGDMSFSPERSLMPSEVVIGRRICSALKKKRELFQTFYDRQKQFRFQGTNTDCADKKTDVSFVASIGNSSVLEYISNTVVANYFRDVVTDQSGAMNDLCVSLAATDNVSNIVKSGSVKYTVAFLISNNYDRYDIKKDLSDGKGGYKFSGAESISVITQSSQAPSKFFGVEKERTRYITCGNNKYQIMGQSWKEAVGDF